jgi:hypothetical protein
VTSKTQLPHYSFPPPLEKKKKKRQEKKRKNKLLMGCQTSTDQTSKGTSRKTHYHKCENKEKTRNKKRSEHEEKNPPPNAVKNPFSENGNAHTYETEKAKYQKTKNIRSETTNRNNFTQNYFPIIIIIIKMISNSTCIQ